MNKYKVTSFLLVIWIHMLLVVVDIFQENAIHPHEIFSNFNFIFVWIFCLMSGITFYNYKNKK